MKLLIVDDHTVVRDGVRRLVEVLPVTAIAEADSPASALDAFRQMRPDVTILDINLRNGSGLEVLKRLRAVEPRARIVVFSMYSDVVYAVSARREGALGYVSKSAPSDELLTAIEKAYAGEAHVDAETASLIEAHPGAAPEAAEGLSRRETQVLQMLGEGRSIADIADGLGVAYKTVANTSTRIKEKLGLERTGDLIRFAVETRGGRLIAGERDGGGRESDAAGAGPATDFAGAKAEDGN